MNGMMKMSSYYLGGDSLFNYIEGMENLFWIDATSNPDELISYDIEKQVEKVNGLMCDKLTIISKDGKTEYYYNTQYSVDPKDYTKHEYGYWKFGIEKTKSLPLKSISDLKEVKIIIVAKEIEEQPINDIEFKIPNLPRVINPEY